MKNVKQFVVHHVGFILTMIAGCTGMNASQSDFKQCLEAKKNFVDMCIAYKLDSKDFASYRSTHNPMYEKARTTCIPVKYGQNYKYDNNIYISQYYSKFDDELLHDFDNAKKIQSLLRCDQLRKDFVASLASVQSEGNTTAVIKVFEALLTDCK